MSMGHFNGELNYRFGRFWCVCAILVWAAEHAQW